MRRWAVALAALAMFGAAPITSAHAQEGIFQRDHGKVAPPEAVGAGGAAPPEGVAAGGLDFGPWRGATPSAYGTALKARIGARIDGKPVSAARADLEANGFTCREGREVSLAAPALDCRIQIADRGCAVEWWAVREEPASPVLAGYDVICPRRR